MAVIKLEALRYLRDRIVCAVPELDGKICVGQALPNHDLEFPSLAIVPAGRWAFYPDQEDDAVFTPAPDRVVCRVGRHEITLQLQIGALSQEQRGELGQQVEQLFYSQEGHPGIIYGAVTACAEEVGPFHASFMLESEDWEDSKAFENQLWSYIEVRASIPALATRFGAYSINELRMGLTEDFGLVVDAAVFNNSTKIARVRINADGTFTALA